ncbi:MAG: hypothetical protein ACTSQY_11690, partial [Candidatus Odinarchaeia archaeon]
IFVFLPVIIFSPPPAGRLSCFLMIASYTVICIPSSLRTLFSIPDPLSTSLYLLSPGTVLQGVRILTRNSNAEQNQCLSALRREILVGERSCYTLLAFNGITLEVKSFRKVAHNLPFSQRLAEKNSHKKVDSTNSSYISSPYLHL